MGPANFLPPSPAIEGPSLTEQGKRALVEGIFEAFYDDGPIAALASLKLSIHFGIAKNNFWDASFLLTVEVFLLTVRLVYLRWGNRKQKRPNPISGQGGP